MTGQADLVGVDSYVALVAQRDKGVAASDVHATCSISAGVEAACEA
jgi:hypothetical protein